MRLTIFVCTVGPATDSIDVLRELMNLQQTLEGQQPGGGVVRVELAEETEDWSL